MLRKLVLRFVKCFSSYPFVVIIILIGACSDGTMPSFIRVYGGHRNDVGNIVRQTSDGGYFIAGYTQSFGKGGEDFYLIRTNAGGDTLWTRTYGGAGDEDDAWAAVITPDGGLAIAGFGNSWTETEDMDVYLLRINAQGETLWTRTYGGEGDDYGWDIQTTLDGGFLIVAQTDPRANGPRDRVTWDVLLIRTDASGDTVWTRTIGGDQDDRALMGQRMPDNGFVLIGYTQSYGAGDWDVYLIRIDAKGEVDPKVKTNFDYFISNS